MRNSRPRFVLAVMMLIVFLGRCAGEEGDATPPFIAGFDRFARHNDVDLNVGGNLLLSELSCVACHASKLPQRQPKLGPRLDGVGDRLQFDWLRRYLAAPQTVKPGTTMPDVLAALSADEKAPAIEALVAFLATQHQPFPEVKATGASPVPHQFWLKGDVERGRALYHQVGCVACHEADAEYEGGEAEASGLDKLLAQLDPEEIEEMGLASAVRAVRSVPHGDLTSKYRRESMTFFLLKPEIVRPSGRMPNLKLSPMEASDLAAYLLRDQTEPDADPNRTLVDDLVAKGRRLFVELQCANCHSAASVKVERLSKPLAELRFDAESKCIGVVRPGLPHFELDAAQTEALRTALLADEQPSAKERVQLTMLQLNCFACHERDQLGGVGRKRRRYFEIAGHVDLGDEGRLPPPLTGVGRKLRSPWLAKVLGGSGDVRPHMFARMPLFPKTAVEKLPELLARADDVDQSPEQTVFAEGQDLPEAGRRLLDTGCVQCHPVRGESLPGVVGVELQGIADRVHLRWFHDFLLDPGQLKERTRMPTFFPNGKSTNSEVLDGHVEQQIAALWTYLKQVDKHPLPDKIAEARSQSFELIPQERPILLRTFMKDAGTHAVAVGFPAKVHFAFDAENVRLAQAWRGRFLDAYGTWFIRFAPPAEPLGVALTDLPPGQPLALLADETETWPIESAEELGYQFSGYRFDRAGVPTLLYRFGEFEIEDRIEPSEQSGLKRQLRMQPRKNHAADQAKIWLRMQAGKSLTRRMPHSYTNEEGLTVIVSPQTDGRAIYRESTEVSEWILPVGLIDDASPVTMQFEYQWKQ